jgi:hypothetical protein
MATKSANAPQTIPAKGKKADSVEQQKGPLRIKIVFLLFVKIIYLT